MRLVTGIADVPNVQTYVGLRAMAIRPHQHVLRVAMVVEGNATIHHLLHVLTVQGSVLLNVKTRLPKAAQIAQRDAVLDVVTTVTTNVHLGVGKVVMSHAVADVRTNVEAIVK